MEIGRLEYLIKKVENKEYILGYRSGFTNWYKCNCYFNDIRELQEFVDKVSSWYTKKNPSVFKAKDELIKFEDLEKKLLYFEKKILCLRYSGKKDIDIILRNNILDAIRVSILYKDKSSSNSVKRVEAFEETIHQHLKDVDMDNIGYDVHEYTKDSPKLRIFSWRP